jgi:chromosome segregation ATPase
LKEITKLESDLSHLKDAKCPFCLQQFDSNEKIAELEKQIDAKKELSKSKEVEANSISLIIDELKSEIANVNSKIKYENVNELVRLKSEEKILRSQLASIAEESNPHVDAYEAMVSEEAISIDYTKLDDMKKMLEHQKFLLKLLVDKNSFIRKKIIGKTIPFLNSRLEQYTSELNLPHTVKFMADMSCEISEYGRTLDHGNLSNGEQKRLNLALSWAFKDVSTHLHEKFNIMFCDEIDSGAMDSNIVDMLIRMIKHKAREDQIGVYVISHRPEFEGRCDTNLYVRKQNGFSSVTSEAFVE